MKEHETPDPQLRQWIDAALDGIASDEVVARLEARLIADPVARSYYRHVAELHAGLRWLHRSDVGDSEFSPSPREAADAPAPVVAPPIDIVQSPNAPGSTESSAQRNVTPIVEFPRQSIFTWGRAAGLGGLAAACLLAVVMLDRREQEQAPPMEPAAATQPVTVLRVESGTTEVAMARVGTVVMQGPAELELLSPSRARLNHGRVRIRITDKSARGFVVETPHGEVTDLGTEFGLDLSGKNGMGVVVFEGAVDLRVKPETNAGGPVRMERLAQGDGVVVDLHGEMRRIMSIVSGQFATFPQQGITDGYDPIIADVRDNLRTADTWKFYEIVPHGMREDAMAYVDRPEHEWNGLTSAGMPKYLIGADYIKPFNDDKGRQDFEMTVTISRPARLFVLYDERLPPPKWLTDGFRKTDDRMGLDVGTIYDANGKRIFINNRGSGAGVDVEDPVVIWERVVEQPGEVKLGPNGSEPFQSLMYCVAAAPLNAEGPLKAEGN